MKTNVLILAYSFPPMGGVAVQRVLKLIKYLPKHGMKPVIVTNAHGLSMVTDESLMHLEFLKDVKVYRIGGESLIPFLKRKISGQKLTFSDFSMALRQIPYMDIYNIWSEGILESVIDIVQREKIDLIYSSSPPHSTHLLARKLKKFSRLPWIMELRDSMTERPTRSPGLITTLQEYIESWYEPRLYRDADGVIFVTNYQRKHAFERCQGLTEQLTRVITNGFDEDDIVSAQPEMKADQVFRITYTGTMSHFDTTTFCTGLKLCVESGILKGKSVEIYIVGTLDEKNRLRFESLSDKIKLVFTGVVSHQRALDYQQKSHCLLLLQTSNFGGKGSEILTGKVFEYIAAQCPILAVVTPGELFDLITKYPLGVAAEPSDVNAINRALGQCYKMSVQNDFSKLAKNSDLQCYTRAYQTKQVAEFINEVLHKKEE